MARVIVGTAGHIDHGKSTLVRALTGTDPDRLPEEKRRGITIDLGYAFFGEIAAIIDVPGHEKLIRNMVAGAATVDYALLVVAADDGVMPQTTEHLHILRLLGIRDGVIVITKCDAVEPEWLDLVEDQVRTAVANTFLENCSIFRVDSVSGNGIAEFRDWLMQTLTSLPSRTTQGVFRLPIDRVFTVKGRGTVITGTILSGSVQKDTRLSVMPGGFDVRVKRLESHGQEADALAAGQRAALNLIGETENLARGQTLALPQSLPSSSRVKVGIDLLKNVEPLKDRQRIRFLTGTQEAIGRVQLISRESSGRHYANLLLEEDVVSIWHDHFVLRRYSPLETLGGGTVLEPLAPALRSRDLSSEVEFARALDDPDIINAVHAILKWRGASSYPAQTLAAELGVKPTELSDLLQRPAVNTQVRQIGDHLLSREHETRLASVIVDHLKHLHEASPESHGFSRTELKSRELAPVPDVVFDRLLDDLVTHKKISREGPLIRMATAEVVLTPAQAALNNQVYRLLKESRFAPPSSGNIAEALNRDRSAVEHSLVLLERSGSCRRLGTDLFFETTTFDQGVEKVRAALSTGAELSVADVARLLDSSRKYVVPFLEYLDRQGITRREGNSRLPGPKFSSA